MRPAPRDQEVTIEDVTGLSDSLKLLLKPYLSEGCPDIRLAAEMAGSSVRTLQRRLSDEGLNYSTLIQQARLESAIHLLKDRQRKVIDVAFEVGYEDPSNFARAFRAFTGLSPLEFRHHAFAWR
jgi:AraC-like DNA-binding protein